MSTLCAVLVCGGDLSDVRHRFAAALAGRYDIGRELGAGGMATVYAADDVRHRRQVAIKMLRPDLAAALGAERFLREIETAANLRHAHIVPLYDSGEAEGFLFYVMPLIEGESLRARLEREGRLPVEEALRIGREVADALAYAHGRGVIHRDVKPENVLLEGGHAVVADFGIARVSAEGAHANLTATGLALGTPRYMSPEQAAGEGVDGRSDQYGLACILFEMLTGQPPFSGATAERLLVQHLLETPPSVTRLRADVPPGAEQALARALSKRPTDRFQTMREFVAALSDPGRRAAAAPSRSVAVLPFLSMSADPENEYFADGITEDVIAQLSRIRALKVVSRASVMRFKGRERPLSEIASELQVSTLLDGSVRRAGTRVRIVAHLVDPQTDQHLWAETYDRELTDIFAIQTEVALQIAGALEAGLTASERVRIGRRPTSDAHAYQLYLQGRHHLIRYTIEGLREALAYFERAIEKDPSFADPHVGIALAYLELGVAAALPADDAYPRASAAAGRALELDPDLAGAHSALAQVKLVYEFDWAGAENGFLRALALSPGDADTYDLYGRLCSAAERFDEALALLRRAQELDPAAHRVDLATALLRAGRYEEALEAIERAIELVSDDARAHATLGWIQLGLGRRTEGLPALERAVSLAPGNDSWRAQLGQAYAQHGETGKAEEILGALLDESRERHVSPYALAYLYTGLGRHDEAMDCLEAAFRDRAGAVYGIKGSFLFRPLHPHPRFQALLGKIRLA